MNRSKQNPGVAAAATVGPVRYSFCIPTFRRPAFLGDVLRSVIAETSGVDVATEVVVVDNDPMQSARPVVEAAMASTELPIRYVSEPRTNLAHARNAAVAAARGDIIVFIDDDQLLPSGFAADLGQRWSAAGPEVVGILPSVRTSYEGTVPPWFAAGKYFDRVLVEASVVPPDRVRTGGLAVKRSVFRLGSPWFDPRWGKLGGEDTAFFAGALGPGDVVIGSAALYVIERVPAERIRFRYVIRDRFRKGMTHALLAMGPLAAPGRARYVVKALGAFTVALGYLCVAPLRGRASVARATALLARQAGKVYAIAGGRWQMYGG